MDPQIISVLQDAIHNLGVNSVSLSQLKASISAPPSPELGDLACNISFRVAKALDRSPFEIAKEIADYIRKRVKEIDRLPIAEIKAVQPGYVNIHYDRADFVSQVIKDVLAQKDAFGSSDHGKGRKVVIEHTATNPCKPLHIGHLRNAVLGDVMGRVYRFCGWSVEVQNLIDDLGRQVATLVWAIKNKLHQKVPRDFRQKFDLWLGRIYSYAAESLTADSNLEEKVDEIMAEAKTQEDIYGGIRVLTEKCVESNLVTCWRMGITYDTLIWESDIARSGVWDDTFSRLKANPSFGYVKEGDKKGCFIVRLRQLPEFAREKDPDKILVRSNGVPTYNAHDIALQMWKFGLSKAGLKFKLWCTQFNNQQLWSSTPFIGDPRPEMGHASRVINVIGYEQNYLQKVLRTTFKLLGLEECYRNSIHLSYKHVRLPGERFSGRTGNWYETRAWADAVIDDVKLIALGYLEEKRSDLIPSVRSEIAEAIAIGTIRYWLTKFNTEQTIIFDRQKATQLEGDAGPFIMYSYVRGEKILKKASDRGILIPEKRLTLPKKDISDETFALVKLIQEFGDIVYTVSEEFQPNLLTSFVYRLATQFNRFYTQCPVLKSKGDVLLFRLQVVKGFTQVLRNAMTLLGIPLVEEM
ncbi:MAG: arginine--tRNA ligase [Candidatus Ranarchaeia archaeon]